MHVLCPKKQEIVFHISLSSKTAVSMCFNTPVEIKDPANKLFLFLWNHLMLYFWLIILCPASTTRPHQIYKAGCMLPKCFLTSCRLKICGLHAQCQGFFCHGAKGCLNSTWGAKKVVDFHDFRVTLWGSSISSINTYVAHSAFNINVVFNWIWLKNIQQNS